MAEIDNLKESIKGLNLLYIESNSIFRESISEDVGEFFKSINIAKDTQESLGLFKTLHSQIVIIDVDSSDFNWLEIAKHIKKVSVETKLIILSKYDDQKSLHDAIDIGVMKFLTKPVKSEDFIESIESAIYQLKQIEDAKLFYASIHGMPNYQESMVLMLEDKKPLLANQIFLDFFDIESIDEFNEIYKDLGSLFLEHEGFLYDSDTTNWFDEVSLHEDVVYHVSIKDSKKDLKHFLLRYHLNEQKSNYAMLSFSDVTALHFAELFEHSELDGESKPDDTASLFSLLELIKKNAIKVHLYNYFKGLTIVNDATVVDVKDGAIILKTDFTQQKAIHYEGKTLLSSEVLPTAVACDIVVINSYEKQSVKLKNIHFSPTSPTTRKTIRLLPDDQYRITLFLSNNRGRYKNRITIEDISLDSIKLKFARLPSDVKEGDTLLIDMVLSAGSKPLIINTYATAFKKIDHTIIFSLNLDKSQKNNMLKYMTNRQIDIIKEFRVLNR